MLVKTAHVNYPRAMLGAPKRGEWTSATAEIDGVKLLAVKFTDLQEKQFIATCSTSAAGEPRSTKHCGFIPRPQIAVDYLKYAAGIDIHNHVRTGSLGLEDVWMTKSSLNCQIAGVLGFVFTNAYLAMKYFGRKPNMKHDSFKRALANQLVLYSEEISREKRVSDIPSLEPSGIHTLKKFPGAREQKVCFFCQHGRSTPKKVKGYQCVDCNIPLCPPTLRDCWDQHIVDVPKKRMYAK